MQLKPFEAFADLIQANVLAMFPHLRNHQQSELSLLPLDRPHSPPALGKEDELKLLLHCATHLLKGLSAAVQVSPPSCEVTPAQLQVKVSPNPTVSVPQC